MLCFFFFKQKTAYEMCGRDWSSDVCSSDLHVFEHRTAEGLSLDMARPDERRAVEVDGPSHYLMNARGRCVVENGPTRLKSRLLRRLGWDVTHVPFFEWDGLRGSEAQDAYLRSKLLAP